METTNTTTTYWKHALLLKADALQKLGKVKEAIECYNSRLSMEPDCERAKEGIKACETIEIGAALKTILETVLKNAEVSEEIMEKLLKKEEIVSTCQRWMNGQDASEKVSLRLHLLHLITGDI